MSIQSLIFLLLYATIIEFLNLCHVWLLLNSYHHAMCRCSQISYYIPFAGLYFSSTEESPNAFSMAFCNDS